MKDLRDFGDGGGEGFHKLSCLIEGLQSFSGWGRFSDTLIRNYVFPRLWVKVYREFGAWARFFTNFCVSLKVFRDFGA